MQTSGWLLGTITFVAIAAVVIVRWINKRNMLRGRAPINLSDMYREEESLHGVNYDLFVKVLNLISQAYHLDARMLRPFDELKRLYDVDSLNLGEGTETLNTLLVEKFGIKEFEVEPKLISELIVEVARHSIENMELAQHKKA